MGKQRIRHIFVSYSRDDKAWTYEFAKAVTDRLGYSVFVDYKSLHIGTNWWRTICEHIKTCDYVLFVMSPMSIESIYCTAEIEYALALNKPILPIMLKSCSFPTKLSQKQVQYLALNDNMQIEQILIELQKGLSDIRDLIYDGEYQAPDPLPNPPDEPKPKDKKSAEEVFHIAIDMMNDADFNQAIELFAEVIRADKTGRWGKLAQKRLKETESYQEVARLLSKSVRDARDLWSDHIAEFGTEYDPLGLASQFGNTPPNNSPQTPVRTTFLSSEPKIITPTRKSLELMPKPFAWVDIPAGQVRLTDKKGYLTEPRTFTLGTFQISKYPITNAQYHLFVDAGGYDEKQWWTKAGWQAKLDGWAGVALPRKTNKAWIHPRYWDSSDFNDGNHPVVGVSWYEAIAFCQWLSFQIGENITLPTEQEWQRSAQGDGTRKYPWGNIFDENRSNTKESGFDKTTSVTQYEGKGDSPFGVVDMSGNVWHWCLTEHKTGFINIHSNEIRIIRGGSWNGNQYLAKNSFRHSSVPYYSHSDVGFFVVCHS